MAALGFAGAISTSSGPRPCATRHRRLATALRSYERSSSLADPTSTRACGSATSCPVRAARLPLARASTPPSPSTTSRAAGPLHALVAIQALPDLGEDVTDAARVAGPALRRRSPRLGRGGAPLASPMPDTDVPIADARRRARAARGGGRQPPPSGRVDTQRWPDSREQFPPLPLLSELIRGRFAPVLAAAVVRRRHGTPWCAPGRARRPASSSSPPATCACLSTDALGKQTELARLGEGAIFGELALVAAQPRSASVEVVGEADLLEFGADALRAAADELPQLADALDRFTRERLLKNLLATSPLFRPFTPQQRLDLARRFTGHDVGAGHRGHPRRRYRPRPLRRAAGRGRGVQGRRAVRADAGDVALGRRLRRDRADPRHTGDGDGARRPAGDGAVPGAQVLRAPARRRCRICAPSSRP